jgi:Rha family phage regulatory protein
MDTMELARFRPKGKVFLKDGQLWVSSRDVAADFGKRYDNVLRDIQRLDCSEEFSRLNFQLVEYVGGKGETRLEYNMTRDGFSFLNMGFTGEKAARFNGRAWVSSRDVAEDFGKEHKNVLQSIQRLDCSEEFSRLNFQPSNYVDDRGKTQPEYLMTRNGFTLLAMGFKGEKAGRLKEAYITMFYQYRALSEEKAEGLTRVSEGSSNGLPRVFPFTLGFWK